MPQSLHLALSKTIYVQWLFADCTVIHWYGHSTWRKEFPQYRGSCAQQSRLPSSIIWEKGDLIVYHCEVTGFLSQVNEYHPSPLNYYITSIPIGHYTGRRQQPVQVDLSTEICRKKSRYGTLKSLRLSPTKLSLLEPSKWSSEHPKDNLWLMWSPLYCIRPGHTTHIIKFS